MHPTITSDEFETRFGVPAMDVSPYCDQFGYYGSVVEQDGLTGGKSYGFFIAYKTPDLIEYWPEDEGE